MTGPSKRGASVLALFVLAACSKFDGDATNPPADAGTPLPGEGGAPTSEAGTTGEPAELLATVPLAYAIGLDDDFVYFASARASDGDIVKRIPKLGGEPVTLQSGFTNIHSLLVVEDGIYVAADSGLQKIPKEGGKKSDVDTNPTSAVARMSNGDVVSCFDSSTTDSSFHYFPKSGVGASFPNNLRFCASISVGNDVAYYGGAYLGRYSRQGGNPTHDEFPSEKVIRRVAVAAEGVFTLPVDDSHVRLVQPSNSIVRDFANTPGGKSVGAGDLVVNDAYVYWTVGDRDGMILRAPRSAPAPTDGEVLASGLDAPTGLAVDATSIYWVENGTGALKRIPKPQ